MSEFTITRKVIDEIALRRSVQLLEKPTSNTNLQQLAKLEIRNGEVTELRLDYRKLQQWCNTFPKSRYEWQAELYESVLSGLELRHEFGLCRFANGFTLDVYHTEAIQLEVVNGSLELVGSVGSVQNLQQEKRKLQLEKQIATTRKSLARLYEKLSGVGWQIRHTSRELADIQGYFKTYRGQFQEAVENAKARRDVKRVIRGVQKKADRGDGVKAELLGLGLLSAPEKRIIENWCPDGITTKSAIQTFDYEYGKYLEQRRKEENYKPKKTWGYGVQKERERRAKNTRLALVRYTGLVARELYSLMEPLSESQLSRFQRNRKWERRLLVELVEVLEQERELQDQVRESGEKILRLQKKILDFVPLLVIG